MDLAAGGGDGGTVVSLLAGDNALTLPKIAEEAEEIVAHAVLVEGLEEARAVDGVVSLPQVEVYLEERQLADAGQFLVKFGFEDGCACAPAGDKAMEGVVESYGGADPGVFNGFNEFPEYLQ